MGFRADCANFLLSPVRESYAKNNGGVLEESEVQKLKSSATIAKRVNIVAVAAACYLSGLPLLGYAKSAIFNYALPFARFTVLPKVVSAVSLIFKVATKATVIAIPILAAMLCYDFYKVRLNIINMNNAQTRSAQREVGYNNSHWNHYVWNATKGTYILKHLADFASRPGGDPSPSSVDAANKAQEHYFSRLASGSRTLNEESKRN